MQAAAGKDALRGGIDLGGTKIQAAIVTPTGEVAARRAARRRRRAAQPTSRPRWPRRSSRRRTPPGYRPIRSRGSAWARRATTDEKTGDVSEARNLPGWEGTFPLGPTLSDALGAQVRIGNDVDVATNAEFKLGSGKPYDSILGVFWGTGVGGGLILDGKRWTGRGAAGEIGHMVVKIDGAQCPCGRRGCMEAYAGRGAMEAKARKDHEDGAKTKLFEIMEERGRDRLTSGSGSGR